ncbi:UbiA prenyltransferase family protein [Aspergillus aurantiobrunneus]
MTTATVETKSACRQPGRHGGWRSRKQLAVDLIVLSRFHLYNGWLATFCGVWATLLAGARKLSDQPGSMSSGEVAHQALCVFVSGYVFCGAGMVWNDLIDSRIDREVARTKNRPLAAGRVTTAEAVVWMMVQYAASWWLLSISLNGKHVPHALIPVTISTLLYPFGKRQFFRKFYIYPQYFLGFTLGYPSVIGQLAISGQQQSFAKTLVQSLPLAITVFAWTIYLNTAYSYQDKAGDAKMKVNSIYVLAGSRIHYFLVLLAGLVLGAIVMQLRTQGSLWLWGSWMCVWAQSLVYQLWRFDAKKPESGGPLHKENFVLGIWTIFVCAVELTIRSNPRV